MTYDESRADGSPSHTVVPEISPDWPYEALPGRKRAKRYRQILSPFQAVNVVPMAQTP